MSESEPRDGGGLGEISWNRVRANLAGPLYGVPGLAALVNRMRMRREWCPKAAARYCYTVWLRHLAIARGSGTGVKPRGIVMEIGPGDTIGVGLAALLSGMERYIAVDKVRACRLAGSLRVFDELLALFAARVTMPGDDGFAECVAADSSGCSPERVREIRKSVLALAEGAESDLLTYAAPYRIADFPEENFANFVVAQATMEHVDEPESLYAAIFRWLAPGGSAAFVVDYSSHGLSARWDGHWALSEREHRRIRGGRPYGLNRLPHSAHMRMLAQCGYRIVRVLRTPRRSTGAGCRHVFANLTPGDLETSQAHILVAKPCLKPHDEHPPGVVLGG